MEGKRGSINLIIIMLRKKLKRKGKKNETTGDGVNKILWIQTWRRKFVNVWKKKKKKKKKNNHRIKKTNEYIQTNQ